MGPLKPHFGRKPPAASSAHAHRLRIRGSPQRLFRRMERKTLWSRSGGPGSRTATIIVVSEFRVQTRAYYQDGTAVAVVGRIDDELSVGTCTKPTGHLRDVIHFDNVLRAVMWKLAIADENSQSTCRKILAGSVR